MKSSMIKISPVDQVFTGRVAPGLGACVRILAFAALIAPAFSAEAQISVAGQGVAQAQEGPGLEEIVVTAFKREQSLQNVPAAISAIGAQAIKDEGITDATNLQFYVPSLVAGTLAGVTAVSIRGVGLNQYGPTSQPGVAVNIDGVYQARTLSGGLGDMDLERVEVLRGPQGTLYGRNATGGAVNFITAEPTDKFEGSLLAGFASYDEYHLNAVLNAPLSDSVRTRLTVDYDDRQHGFVENVIPGGPDADMGSVVNTRLKIAADLASNLEADLSVFYLHRVGAFPWLQLVSPPSAAAITGNPFLAGTVVPTEPLRFSADAGSESDLDTYGGSATFNLSLGSTQLKSITAYSWYDYHSFYDSDGTNVSFVTLGEGYKSTTFSQEFDLHGALGSLDWLFGVFYMDDDLRNTAQFDFPSGYPASLLVPGGSLTTANVPYRTQSGAVFTDDTIGITSKLRMIVGARYSQDKVTTRSDTTVDGLEVAPGFVLPTLVTCDGVLSDPTFRSLTPRAGLQYDVSSEVGSYFTVSRGFKDGGVDGCNTIYQPEKITAYEGGLRTRLFGDTVTLNPTIFYYDYTDFQVTEILGLTSPVVNAPKATELGFELESSWRANSHLSVNANLTLLDGKYGAGFYNTDTLNLALGAQDLSGKRLNRAPTASGSVGFEYRTSESEHGRLSFRANVYASSRVYFREFNSPLDSQSPYSVANLSLIWDSSSDRYSTRFYVNNVGDTHSLSQVGASDSYGSRFAAYAPPRQLGVELRAKF